MRGALFDFSSWSSILVTIMSLLLMTLLMMGVRLLFMQTIQKISPVPLRFDEIDDNANGYYHNADKEIVIKKGLSESQTLKTAIHETAHAKLHDKEIMESLGVEKDRLTKEVEAAAGK